MIRLILCLMVLGSGHAYGDGLSLVIDLDLTPASSEPREFTSWDDSLYFSASTPGKGRELWKSDGTEAGTTLVMDIFPGDRDSNPTEFTPFDGELYFRAYDATGGAELWRTDGTEAGTQTLDLRPGMFSSSPSGFQVLGDQMCFSARSEKDGFELWVTDGTVAGTEQLVDIEPGLTSSSPRDFIEYDDRLFFTVSLNGDRPLWMTDGTAAGTQSVGNPSGEDMPPDISNLIVVDGTLYFLANDGFDQAILSWDGTDMTTVWDEFSGYTDALLCHDETLYFYDHDGDSPPTSGLWKTNGTPDGTELIHDFLYDDDDDAPKGFASSDGKLFVTVGDATHGRELWVSDDTEGMVRVMDIHPGSDDSVQDHIDDGVQLRAVGDRVVFVAEDGVSGVELWWSDGTEAGTAMVEIHSGDEGSFPRELFIDADAETVITAATDGDAGVELWQATVEDATLVADMAPGTAGDMDDPIVYDGQLYYGHRSGTTGVELHRSDGTAEGTELAVDINSGGDARPNQLIVFDGEIIFAATTPDEGEELWKSDGTELGTSLIGETNPGALSGRPFPLAIVGGELFLRASGGVFEGTELWKTDGDSVVLVKDIDTRLIRSGLASVEAIEFNGQLYFNGRDEDNGEELWRSDGTDAGTILVADVHEGSESSHPYNKTVFGDELFFVARDEDNGTELWKTDGTTTELLLDINTGSEGSFPRQPVVYEDALYFVAFDDENGYRLWTSDGTSDGTEIALDRDVFRRPGLSVVAGSLFLTAVNDDDEPMLIITDGTEDGTIELADAELDRAFGLFEGLVYFSATSAEEGTELWRSDGTPEGTEIVSDHMPGPGSSIPRVAKLDGNVYVMANSEEYGRELHVLVTADPFARGDVDGNGTVFAIVDTLELLDYGFNGGETPGCLAAADVDGNGVVFPIIDGLYLLQYGFSGGPPPPVPGPSCGLPPAGELLSCETPPEACQ